MGQCYRRQLAGGVPNVDYSLPKVRPKQYKLVPVKGHEWEGNRGSGFALVTRHGVESKGLSKGHKHPATILVGYA